MEKIDNRILQYIKWSIAILYYLQQRQRYNINRTLVIYDALHVVLTGKLYGLVVRTICITVTMYVITTSDYIYIDQNNGKQKKKWVQILQAILCSRH